MNQLTHSPQTQRGLRTLQMPKLEAVGYNLNQDYSTWGEVSLLTKSGMFSVKRGNEFTVLWTGNNTSVITFLEPGRGRSPASRGHLLGWTA